MTLGRGHITQGFRLLQHLGFCPPLGTPVQEGYPSDFCKGGRRSSERFKGLPQACAVKAILIQNTAFVRQDVVVTLWLHLVAITAARLMQVGLSAFYDDGLCFHERKGYFCLRRVYLEDAARLCVEVCFYVNNPCSVCRTTKLANLDRRSWRANAITQIWSEICSRVCVCVGERLATKASYARSKMAPLQHNQGQVGTLPPPEP